MDIHQLKTLISNLDTSDPSVFDETKKALIEHANDSDVFKEFLNILCYGSKRKRVNLVDVLSDIHTEQSFNLLMYSAHDSYRRVSDRVFDNFKKTSDPNHVLFFIEATLSYKEGSKSVAQEQALSWIQEHKRGLGRKYFLPLIQDYLTNNQDIDLTVRGKLLSVLAHHDVLDGTENLIDAMRYGDFDVKEYAIKKLDSVINNGTRKRIYHALLEALQQEYHPDIRSLLKKTLNPEDDNSSVFSTIQSSSDWFAEAVLYFRKLGFYQEYDNLTNDKLIEKIKNLRNHKSEDKLAHNTDLLLIFAEDKRRVWYCDAEIYYDQQYVKLLKQWGDMSCGEFLPENIVEMRDEKNDKIHLRFSHKKHQIEFYLNDFNDWVDPGIFEEINEIIKDSKIQFCTIVTDTQEICLASLTVSQKMHMERDLGLKFEISGRYISPPKL